MTMFGDGSAVVPLESLQRYLTTNNDSTMKYEASAGLCSKLWCTSPCFQYVVVSCGISSLGGKVVQPDATARAWKCVMHRVHRSSTQAIGHAVEPGARLGFENASHAMRFHRTIVRKQQKAQGGGLSMRLPQPGPLYNQA